MICNNKSIGENSFDTEITLDASSTETDEDGILYESSVNGVLQVTFENGYLTHSLDEASMLEKMSLGDEFMSLEISTKVETSISYSFEDLTIDLTDWQKLEL